MTGPEQGFILTAFYSRFLSRCTQMHSNRTASSIRPAIWCWWAGAGPVGRHRCCWQSRVGQVWAGAYTFIQNWRDVQQEAFAPVAASRGAPLLPACLWCTNPLPPAPAAIAAQALSAPHAMARRDGRWQEVAVRELVPGDLVALKGGDVVPADCKVGGGAGGGLGRLVWVNGWVAIRCRGAQLDFRTKACGCLTQCIHLRRTPLPSSACQLLTLPPWAGPCCDSAAGGAG